jgi:YidC/Oxa1 family membrane protein insertase
MEIAILVEPIINLLVLFYHALTWAHIPYALGFAIILLTVFIRLLMYPLTTKQLQMTKKMQELAPHMSKIKEKHKGDMKRQQEATMALYREHNVNPAAGCLPGLVQIVILLFGLYPALMKIVSLNTKAIVETVNGLVYIPALNLTTPWSTDFFGIPLGKTPADLLPIVGPIIFLVPILTGVFQFVQSKMMMPATPKGGVVVVKTKPDDFATTFQKQSLYLLPVMIGFFSWHFSVGLSLYWNTFTIFGIIQQYLVAGLGGVEDWRSKFKKKK